MPIWHWKINKGSAVAGLEIHTAKAEAGMLALNLIDSIKVINSIKNTKKIRINFSEEI